MTQYIRFYAHQWGNYYNGWSVLETPGGGREKPISVISCLTRPQAMAIAEMLNDMAGLDWQNNHPDWWNEVQPIRDAEHAEVMRRWEENQARIRRRKDMK